MYLVRPSDLYSRVAAEHWNVPVEDVTLDMRQDAKRRAHGSAWGVKGLLAAGALALLAGCASDTYSKFRPDAEPWDRAHGECMSRAAQVNPQFMRAELMRQVYEPCMQARGWRRDS